MLGRRGGQLISCLCCKCRQAARAAVEPVNTAVNHPAGSTHLAAADSLARLSADVRTALGQRDHQQLAVLLQQCSGHELASMRLPLPLFHATAGSGWAEGVAMLARRLPVSAADEEVAVLYSLLPHPPPGCQRHGFGSHTALSLAAALGHSEVAGALLAAGADANACGPAGCPPLFWAACSARRAAAALPSMLVAAGARLGVAGVHAVMDLGIPPGGSTAQLLLQQLAWQHQPGSLHICKDIHLGTLAGRAVECDSAAIFECFDSQTVARLEPAFQLETAAGMGKIAVLQYLLARYWQVDPRLGPSDGATALAAAQIAGHDRAVAVLLEAGCQPSLHNLHYAVATSNSVQLEALLGAAQPAEEDDQRLEGHVRSSTLVEGRLRSTALPPGYKALPSLVHAALCRFSEVGICFEGR